MACTVMRRVESLSPVGDLRRAQGSTLQTAEAEIDSLPYANRLANRLVDKIQGTA